MPHPKDIPMSLSAAVLQCNELLQRYERNESLNMTQPGLPATSTPLSVHEAAAIGKILSYVTQAIPPAWRAR
jgi:hypothetical protein